MGRLAQFLLFVLLDQIVVSQSLIIARDLCPTDQGLLLLQFKQSVNITAPASFSCEHVPSYPKMVSWNTSTDCCIWDGVTCDELTGQVIGLDLSCGQIQGAVNSNSSLFQLSHPRNLNLAYNDFSSSSIPSNFSRLGSLTYLNFSESGFTGLLPLEISRLPNLVALDLSSCYDLTVQPSVFRALLQNSSKLREAVLPDTNIGAAMPRNLSASLTIVDLSSTSLYGELLTQTFQLPNLQQFVLHSNSLTGNLPVVKWNSSSALSYLDLGDNYFSGEVPESFGNLKSLNYLDLSSCLFSGTIPKSLGNFTQMTSLSLFYNNFSGQVPSSLANLDQLTYLDLSSNSLQGQLPNFFSNFTSLTTITLDSNFFVGSFPSSVINLTQLRSLDLSNNSLRGPLPSNIVGYPNLSLLFLGENSFDGPMPSWVSSLPSLKYLDLSSNQLTGQLYEFRYQSLQRIYLSGNNLNGSIPESVSQLVNLTVLDLSSNNFSGDIDVSLFSNLNQLDYLDLSFNNLSLITDGPNATMPPSIGSLLLSSCGVKDLDFLNGASLLQRLDLYDNMLRGPIFTDEKSYNWGPNLFYLNLSRNFLTEIPQIPFQGLVFLDLRSNLLSGSFPIPPVGTKFFFASNNVFTGDIPSSICKLNTLIVLDLSDNNLDGAIPQCLGNMSSQIAVLDLHSNNFHGVIPSNFAVVSSLQRLNLRDNWLEGMIPQSLSKCRELQVVDLGNNNLNGSFPWWLETLPNLEVLSLRDNNLNGPLNISGAGLSFPALRILDLSGNEFTGVLPTRLFSKLRGMKIMNGSLTESLYTSQLLFYQDSVMMMSKGLDLNFVLVLSIFTTIDLSSNRFQGTIPDVIGSLVGLRGLNLSHNNLSGQIPTTLGNLRVLESLDLSWNQLEGEIPQQLTGLTYLSDLNLSENHLVGSIPQGQQFQTFVNTSYLGNVGLCGFPMSKPCGGGNELRPPISSIPAPGEEGEDGHFFEGITWKAVLIGYGCGMVVGVIMGCLSFITGKPIWFNSIVRLLSSKVVEKKWPKEIKWL